MEEPVLTPVTHSNKAVAVGAVSFRLDHFVTARIAKFTFGASCSRSYEPSNPEHVKRDRKTFLDLIGDKWVPDCFETMLPRVRRKLSSSVLLGNFSCAIG